MKFSPAVADAPSRYGSALRTGSASLDQSVQVLIVSSGARDHSSLRNCLKGSAWSLRSAHDFDSALHAIKTSAAPIVICTDDVQGGSWQDLLEQTNACAGRTKFVLATSDIDSRLWAEALQLGACDVIARPFNVEEVLHVVRTAWLSCGRVAHAVRAAC